MSSSMRTWQPTTPVRRRFPSGEIVKVFLGDGTPTAVGSGGFLWAEPTDIVEFARYGRLVTSEDWDFIRIDLQAASIAGDWVELYRTSYEFRVDGKDRVNEIWIKEVGNGEG